MNCRVKRFRYKDKYCNSQFNHLLLFLNHEVALKHMTLTLIIQWHAMRANKVKKKYINIYRKSASRFLRGTVLNALKQSRINIMRGKKGRNIDVQSRQANYVSCFSLRFFHALAASCVL